MYTKSHGPEVDIWSLGIVLMEMCTGHVPIRATTYANESQSDRSPSDNNQIIEMYRGITHSLTTLVGSFPFERKLVRKRKARHPSHFNDVQGERNIIRCLHDNRINNTHLHELLKQLPGILPTRRIQAGDALKLPVFNNPESCCQKERWNDYCSVLDPNIQVPVMARTATVESLIQLMQSSFNILVQKKMMPGQRERARLRQSSERM